MEFVKNFLLSLSAHSPFKTKLSLENWLRNAAYIRVWYLYIILHGPAAAAIFRIGSAAGSWSCNSVERCPTDGVMFPHAPRRYPADTTNCRLVIGGWLSRCKAAELGYITFYSEKLHVLYIQPIVVCRYYWKAFLIFPRVTANGIHALHVIVCISGYTFCWAFHAQFWEHFGN